jgi:FkbM family methyltransferase
MTAAVPPLQDFKVLARDWQRERETNRQRAKDFLSRAQGQKVSIFGLTAHAPIVRAALEKISSSLQFIDDSKAGQTVEGLPVLPFSALKAGDRVVNTVFYGRLVDAEAKLAAAGVDFISYPALSLADEAAFPLEFCSENEKVFEQVAEWSTVLEGLADEASREAYWRMLAFRTSFSAHYLEPFVYAIDRQYFEPFLAELPVKVFVDGGSYDGATSHEFARRYPDYEQIHMFEPNPKAPLLDAPLPERSTLHPFGLGAEAGTVYFDDSKGSASTIAESGETRIDICPLDGLVSKADWVKLDVEGAEIAALLGAEQLIRRCKPVLSVAIYHRQSDFWEVPRYVLSLNPDYRIKVIHYSRGLLETVMFFY